MMEAIMRIGAQRIVSMRYTMRNSAGEILSDNMEDEPVTFLHGSGEILPTLEKPLTGLKIGEQKQFCVTPDDSNGLHTPLYFDVIIDDIRWATAIQTDATPVSDDEKECGPGCCC